MTDLSPPAKSAHVPKPRPEWARSFTLEELPAEYRDHLSRLGDFVEPEHGPGPYARRAEDVVKDFLERLNYKPNVTRARDEIGAAYPAPSVGPEAQADRARLIVEQRLRDAWAHLGGMYRDTIKKLRDAEPVPAPPLEEFDPESGELFVATDEKGLLDIGIAWVAEGRLFRTTLSTETRRLSLKYEGALAGGTGQRARDEVSDEHQRELERLLRSLPFTRPKDALWPLPDDPTLESTREFEARQGPLLDRLRDYFRDRVCTFDSDCHDVMALWSIGASARSPLLDFAPRLMLEAPFGWGKSASAEAVQLVVPRAVYGAAVSPAAAYRVMNEWHPVLLVDESAVSENPELQRVLRAGFKRGARILRAAQDADRGIVTIDPFGWVILTTQVDTRDDLINRCYVLFLSPGVPKKRVSSHDDEARSLRTALTRLRLDILLGAEYPDLGRVAEQAQTAAGLEPRSRDKLSSLWPFAARYGVQDRLAAAAARLEEESSRQFIGSDKGLVATAIGSVVASAGGLSSLKATDLDLTRIQEQLEVLLVQMGEATEVPIGQGETIRRVDLRRYGPRDFTARVIRELGLRLRPVMGKARIELRHFLQVWPSISSRYAGVTTLDDYVDPSGGGVGGSNMPTPPTRAVGSSRGLVGVSVASGTPPFPDERTPEIVGIVGIKPPHPPPTPSSSAIAGRGNESEASGALPPLPEERSAAERVGGAAASEPQRERIGGAVTALQAYLSERSGGSQVSECLEHLITQGYTAPEGERAVAHVCGDGSARLNGEVLVLKSGSSL